MQKGLAMLEIIFAIIIIAVLAKVAVPNVTYIIDIVSLNYETKRFYSELRFVQELSRSSKISSVGMGSTKIITNSGETPTLIITSDKKSYQIFRGTSVNKKAIREPHYLANGVKITVKGNMINFDLEGKANVDSVTLTSQFGKEKIITFDSVGRVRVKD